MIVHLFWWIVHLVAVDAKSAGNPTFPFAPGLGRICRVGGNSLLCSISWCTVPCQCRIPTGMPATPQSPALHSFQIEVLPQGKAWQDVPGVQGDPRSCIVVPSGLATPLLVLEGDDPPQPQPICAFLFSIPLNL